MVDSHLNLMFIDAQGLMSHGVTMILNMILNNIKWIENFQEEWEDPHNQL